MAPQLTPKDWQISIPKQAHRPQTQVACRGQCAGAQGENPGEPGQQPQRYLVRSQAAFAVMLCYSLCLAGD